MKYGYKKGFKKYPMATLKPDEFPASSKKWWIQEVIKLETILKDPRKIQDVDYTIFENWDKYLKADLEKYHRKLFFACGKLKIVY
jgi:hypothetical protein